MRKCGICLIRGLQFFCTSWLIPKVAAPKGELQSPDEEKTTFSQKYPDFSSNSTRFLGSKVAIFFCGKVRKIFADYEEKSKVRKIVNKIFPQKKCQFRPQKTSRIQREFGFFFKKCGTFLIRSRQFSCRDDYLGDLPAPLEELQSPDEENTTFSEKKPDFLLKLGFRNWLKIR